MKVKRNTLAEQRAAAELELIIEAFGNAMRNANREYLTRTTTCSHEDYIRFTPNMRKVWTDYIVFCLKNPS